MRISVISFKGAPPPRPLGFDFDAGGGSIGREESNQLALPDPERHISRVQARVEFSGQQFMLVDMGGNPSLVNGRPLGKGNRIALTGGEEIAIGDYMLRVEFSREAPVFSTPAAAPSPRSDDPLGLFGGEPAGGAATVSDPFAGLLGGSPAPAGGFTPSPSLPSDDPFAVFAVTPPPAANPPAARASGFAPDPFAPPPPPPPAPRADVLGLGALRSEDSLDSLFGLGAGTGSDPFAGTPLGEAPPAAPKAGDLGVDPMALFGGPAAVPSAAPQRDDAPLLNEAFLPPRPMPAVDSGPELTRVISPRSATPAPAAEFPPASGGGMVLSWEDPGDASTREVPQRAVPEPEPAPPPPPVAPIHVAAKVERVGAEPVVAPEPVPHPASLAEDGDLLAAFERGLGVPVKFPAGLTPELMEQIGVVLREATQGTLDLLQARALTKREVRAEVTMIVSKGNNPLKFSPDVGFALSQLLVPQGRGFMKPDAAMRDAYDDLRAHQFGFMAGMRAALDGVLKRFQPATLEQRVVSRSVLDNILPGSRKARMWDLFEQMYGEISREAEDDFHALFGREFLKAYEEQVERLQAERDAGR